MKLCSAHFGVFTKIFSLLILFSSFQANAQLDRTEKKLSSWVDEHNDEALTLLKEIININSGSMNFPGVRQVADVLIPKFEALGMEASFLDGSSWNRAGHLVAKIEG
ncbi:MAG: M20 family peptidase, partial [Cytophagia bacterium]|nr:M20 family peptidase [Cytophagia bacterium]